MRSVLFQIIAALHHIFVGKGWIQRLDDRIQEILRAQKPPLNFTNVVVEQQFIRANA